MKGPLITSSLWRSPILWLGAVFFGVCLFVIIHEDNVNESRRKVEYAAQHREKAASIAAGQKLFAESIRTADPSSSHFLTWRVDEDTAIMNITVTDSFALRPRTAILLDVQRLQIIWAGCSRQLDAAVYLHATTGLEIAHAWPNQDPWAR